MCVWGIMGETVETWEKVTLCLPSRHLSHFWEDYGIFLQRRGEQNPGIRLGMYRGTETRKTGDFW